MSDGVDGQYNRLDCSGQCWALPSSQCVRNNDFSLRWLEETARVWMSWSVVVDCVVCTVDGQTGATGVCKQ